jgi:hypothetical protein
MQAGSKEIVLRQVNIKARRRRTLSVDQCYLWKYS